MVKVNDIEKPMRVGFRIVSLSPCQAPPARLTVDIDNPAGTVAMLKDAIALACVRQGVL